MTLATDPLDSARPPGKAGDFDFLNGSWNIQHRRFTELSTWDSFEGEATCWSILGGAASIEELRIPSRDFHGMGLRLLNRERRVWSDFWMNAKSGVLLTPATEGYFDRGEGIFVAQELDGDQVTLVRGTWDQITPTSCRWHQATSRDGGAAWTPNWVMEWQRSD